MKLLSVVQVVLACYVTMVRGHGRLLEPPSRSSMFRFASSDPILLPYRDVIQPNYDDNGLNCGGRQVQINNNGKCGVCGDSFTAAVKENEAGGKYALGIITRNYEEGQVINITVEITAEHKGYFEFRLCPWNNVNKPITHECLNQHLLTFENNETKWYLPKNPSQARGFHNFKIKLPDHVTCQQCVLQWRYRTGNSWGSENGEQGLGLGQQEEFYGCSDVSIEPSESSSSSLPETTTEAPTQTSNDVTTLSSSTSSSSTMKEDTTTSITTDESEATTQTSNDVTTLSSSTSLSSTMKEDKTTSITTNESEATTQTSNDVTTLSSITSSSSTMKEDTTTSITTDESEAITDLISSTVIPNTASPTTIQYPDVDCSQVELGNPIFRDCHSFYICAYAQYDPYILACPPGTVCNPNTGRCDHPYNVPPPCHLG